MSLKSDIEIKLIFTSWAGLISLELFTLLHERCF
jgi:hypothetical protein